VTRLVKYSLLGCMGQVLQQDLWQGKELVVGRGGQGVDGGWEGGKM